MKNKQRFSLRKLSAGFASVSIGALVFVSDAHVANAEDTPTKSQSEQTQKANDKDAQAVNAQVELAKKVGAEQEAKENAQNVQKQAELAQKVAVEQATNAQVENAKNVAKEQVKNAQTELDQLTHLSKAKKNAYKAQINKADVANIPGIVQNAKAEDYQVGVAQNVANEQAQIENAQKVAAEQVQKAQTEVNALSSISKETKAVYNNKIAAAAIADIPAIVKDAKAVNAQVELAQKAGAEQAQVENAKKVAAEQVKKGQAEIKQLTHLSKKQKDAFNNKIAAAAVADIPAIVKEAKDLDAKQATKKEKKGAKKIPENKVTTGQLKTGNPKQNKKEHGTTRHHKSTEHDQTSDTHTSTPHTKVITGQTEDQNASKVTKDEIKNQLKVKHNKKQLPETGEQDQVLFGMLAGSLFASAGTLFLLQARRKENK